MSEVAVPIHVGEGPGDSSERSGCATAWVARKVAFGRFALTNLARGFKAQFSHEARAKDLLLWCYAALGFADRHSQLPFANNACRRKEPP